MRLLFFPTFSWSNTRRGGIFCCLVILIASLTTLYLRHLADFVPEITLPATNEAPFINLDETLRYRVRTTFATRTSWNAPIMWDGMFNPELYDQQHIRNKSTVALTVFAVGGYLDVYLNNFLTSAEKHFMTVLPVTFYVFTDRPEKVPNITLGAQRHLKVIQVEKHSRWQDISMMRMKTISDTIESDIQHHFKYVFCFDVDQEFKERFGTEALGDSVALMHSNYFRSPPHMQTFDRNPKSKAYMEHGDYYYHAALFGGSWQCVKDLVNFCYDGIMEDKKNNVEALWHDESHLNKFFWLHKPSKILSPEYCWFPGDKDPEVHIARLIWAPKHYDTLRTR